MKTATARVAQEWMQRIADAGDGPYKVTPNNQGDQTKAMILEAFLNHNPFLTKESAMKALYEYVVIRHLRDAQVRSSEEAQRPQQDPDVIGEGRVWATSIGEAKNRVFAEMENVADFSRLEILLRPFCG